MSVGAFFDKIIFIGFGIYTLYIYKKNKEKLGNKAKWVLCLGIAFILLAIINSIGTFLR